jgi:hypothetical protein
LIGVTRINGKFFRETHAADATTGTKRKRAKNIVRKLRPFLITVEISKQRSTSFDD